MERRKRRTFGWRLLLAVLCLVGGPAAGSTFRNAYSPHNAVRPKRSRTDYIVLHTTEGRCVGSLDKVRRNGEAHYFIDEAGQIYCIIDRQKVAYHCGRSMWDGRRNIDNYAVGIEVVGYHNKPVTVAQKKALSGLLTGLQAQYRIPDERVLTHSMVAYGAPNRWHTRLHRGRKRCGMQFAQKTLRRQIGLTAQPAYDPDVRAGRLVVADPILSRILYGSVREQVAAVSLYGSTDIAVVGPGRSAWDIARDEYNSANTVYVFPDGTRRNGNEITDWTVMPNGTRVVLGETPGADEIDSVKRIGKDGERIGDIAGAETNKATTLYVMANGEVRRGDELSPAILAAIPKDTRMLVGYTYGGYITGSRSAYDICGSRWNHPSTFYLFTDGAIRRGSELDENAIPRSTQVFFRD